MDPLPPNDPLYKLLGNARQVGPRPNFTQNVLRAVRNEPLPQGFWARLQSWTLHSPAPKAVFAALAVTLLTLLAVQKTPDLGNQQSLANAPQITAPIEETSAPVLVEAASELESMDQLSLLLASQDTRSLSDSEIALLLY